MQAHDRKNPFYLQPFAKSTPASTAVSSSNRQRRQRRCLLHARKRRQYRAHPDTNAQNWPSLTAIFSEIWQSRTATFSDIWP